MKEVGDVRLLARLCRGDSLPLWAAQGLGGRSRAWMSGDGDALAVAGPDLAKRDRLVLWGQPGAAVPLIRCVREIVGPGYRPLGDPGLLRALAGRFPWLAPEVRFGWMDRTAALPGPGAGAAGPEPGVGWLPGAALPEVAEFIEVVYPASYAKPGMPGVERWAGVRHDGDLAAVGALAWSAPTVGFMSGVAVRPGLRGQGLGRVVCRFLAGEALRRHGTVALMVDDWNQPARRLYASLGLRYRQVCVASLR